MLRYFKGVAGVVLVGSAGFAGACGSPAGQGTETLGATSEGVTKDCAVTPLFGQSLEVTNATVLAQFPLKSVLSQIVSTGSTTNQTALGLYQQLIDTLNTKALGTTKGPHCDDDPSDGKDLLNGFPTECPRQEGTLSATDPFPKSASDITTQNAFQPTAVVNRFDLAPADGSNCGEYRVVYAKNSGIQNPIDRMFLIFEATLPNPDPSKGLAACLPVAQFWDNLSKLDLATSLESFYFKGLSGFEPVIQAKNYGIGGGSNTGQIRSNMFMNIVSGQGWELREFRLSQSCTGKACTLTANNTLVQTNPDIELFSGSTAADLAFQKSFLTQVPTLAADSIPLIGMSTPSQFAAGESISLTFPADSEPLNDYLEGTTPSKTFLANIKAAILKANPKSKLTAENILSRATSQSCAGCHELTQNDQQLGGGLTWPQSNGFTQIDERSTLSPALTGTFLPFRAGVLEDFIDKELGCTPGSGTGSGTGTGTGSGVGSSGSGSGVEPPPPPPPTQTVGGGVVGAAS